MDAVGSKLGEHLARIVGEAVVHAVTATADGKAEHTRAAIDNWLEGAEEAYGPMMAQMFGDLAEHPDLPENYRIMFQTMAGPEHQWDWLVQVVGVIGAAIALLPALGAIDVQPLVNKQWATYPTRPLSPPDLADMVERNIVGQAWAEGEAMKSGIPPNDFDLLVKDTGEPYGIEQALSLLRRGVISEERFTEVLYYSRVRNEFLPDVIALAHDTMTQGDAIEGALKGVLDTGAAADLFSRAGGLPEQFQTLLDIAGNPIGVESALNLWNHGLIDEAQVTQIILHSRINPIFEQVAKLQRFRFLAPYQIVQAVKAGTATVAQATEWLLAEGYPHDQVTAVLTANAGTATVKAKEASESQVAEMYEAGAITQADALARLAALGYGTAEGAFILSVYDEKRKLSMIQSAVGQVRKVYLAGRIDDTTAGNLLNQLGVDPEAQTIYLTVWKVEAQSELRELTAAQIGSMFKKGLFTEAQAIARWESMGYDAADAQLLSANYGGTPPPDSPAAQTPTTGTAGA